MTEPRRTKTRKRPAARRATREKSDGKDAAHDRETGRRGTASSSHTVESARSQTGGRASARHARRASSQDDDSDAGQRASGGRRAAKPSRARQAAQPKASGGRRPAAAAVAPRQPVRASAQDQVFEVQRDLDSLLRDVDRAHGDADARRRAAEAIGQIASRLDSVSERSSGGDADAVLASARELVSPSYYARRWSRLGMRNRADEVDEFGLDKVFDERVQPMLDALFESYFRVQVQGMEHIPSEGGALLVCNRGGTLPWDGVMLKTAVSRHAPEGRELRWLTEDFNFHAPFLGPFLNRIGAVRACQANAERLLDRGSLVGVFPEGIKGVSKTYGRRYQLQRFGRGGHVKLALRRGVPIVPVAIVGAEDAHPLLFRIKFMSKAVGVPFFPVTPTFPWLGPVGLLPLPSRWRIVVGPPVDGLSDRAPDDANDTVLVNELNERIRATVQQLLDDAQVARGHRWV